MLSIGRKLGFLELNEADTREGEGQAVMAQELRQLKRLHDPTGKILRSQFLRVNVRRQIDQRICVIIE